MSYLDYPPNCIPVDKLDPSVFNNVCVAVTDNYFNQTAYTIGLNALITCCGANDVTTIGGCYTYCNVTTFLDTEMLTNCLSDSMDPDTPIDYDCFPLQSGTAAPAQITDTKAGMIATTWTYADQTYTITESGSTWTETYDFSGNLLTTNTAKSTPAAKVTAGAAVTTDSKVTGTTATSTSSSTSASTTASGGSAVRISYGAGILVALSVVGLVL